VETSKLAAFTGQKYLNLETFRKNGQGVPTPIWFVEMDGVLYVRTGAESGKVKRIRNQSRVRVAPCDRMGKLYGDWMEASAHLVDGPLVEQVNNLIKRKYGLLKALFDLFGSQNKMKSATIAIDLA